MPVSTATDVPGAALLLADALSPVVVVAIHDAYADTVRCIEAIAAHTAADVAVLVVDDAGSDRRMLELLAAVGDRMLHNVVVLHHHTNQGFVRACNNAFEATSGRDVVIVNSDVIVGPEWLERLSAVARSDDTIATVTSLTNSGSIVSVPYRNQSRPQLPDGMTPDDAARRVAAGSLGLRPPIPAAIGHCVYLRRHALDLVGAFDLAFEPGYGEEVDFSQRAAAVGFRHVVADDVFTYHRGRASFGISAELDDLRERHEALVRRRHPWYEEAMRCAAEDPSSPLAAAIGAARRALLGLSVGIDGTVLGPTVTGTQQIVVQTIRALSTRPEISRLVVFTPLHLHDQVNELRTEMPGVEFIGVNHHVDRPDRVVDIMYRPCQINALHELDFVAHAGERFVVNQLDTIAFENPAYFATAAAWSHYRDLTRLTTELANGVAFISERGRGAAISNGLVRAATPTMVVGCGVDTDADSLTDDVLAAHRPSPLGADDDGFLLCIGVAYLHKNRPLVLDLWATLRRRGWAGRLVFAGPTPTHGSSLAAEAEHLLAAPDLRADVVTLGAVTEGQKKWLYRHAALVLYPSTVEGFGLVPFEAAAHGVATLSSRQGGLDEVLPAGIPVIERFDVGDVADRAWALLHDPAAAAALVDALRARGRTYTWEATADRLIALFDDALRQPRGRVLALEGEGEHPIGLATRSHRVGPRPGAVSAGTDEMRGRLVRAIASRPGLKQVLSPDGSTRQRAARRVIAFAHRADRTDPS